MITYYPGTSEHLFYLCYWQYKYSKQVIAHTCMKMLDSLYEWLLNCDSKVQVRVYNICTISHFMTFDKGINHKVLVKWKPWNPQKLESSKFSHYIVFSYNICIVICILNYNDAIPLPIIVHVIMLQAWYLQLHVCKYIY